MSRASARDIAQALGRGRETSQGPNSYKTLCPAHADSTPSLSVTEKAGKILLHCHGGCSFEQVVTELRSRGLWAPPGRTWVAQKFAPRGKPDYSGFPHPKLGQPTTWFKYVDAEDRVRGFVVRFERHDPVKNKTVKDTIPVTWCRCAEDGEERWWWKGFQEPRSCYREEELLKYPTRHVLVLEGEKKTDRAQEIVGDTYVVISWQGGGKAVNRTDWSILKGRDVTLWRDCDVPGEQAMRSLAEILLKENAKVVRSVEISEEILLAAGVPPSDVVGWDLGDEIPEGMKVGDMLASAVNYFPVGDVVVERFNRNFAMVLVGGSATVLEERVEDGELKVDYVSISGFKEFYGNRLVLSGKSQVPESTHWLKHAGRRSYSSITFKPVLDTPGQYNLWRGFSHEPDPTGSWDLLKTHVLENIAQGDESLSKWVIAWFAQMIQHPDRKIGTSLSLRGKQGTGKTELGRHVGQLFKPHYVLVDKPHMVTGNFNSHMASCLMLHADEAFFAGNPAQVGQLKSLVTSETIRVEPKGRDSFELRNYVRLLATSNNSWVVPAGFEERRFAVLDVGTGRMQDRDWFTEMRREMEDGGYAAMLHELLRTDIVTVDPAKIPQTKALQEQKLHSLDTVTRFWHERLHDGEVVPGAGTWPSHVVISDLHEAYIRTCISWGEPRRMDATNFKSEMRKFFTGGRMELIRVSLSRAQQRADPSRPTRPWAAALESLSAHRETFERVVGGRVEWDQGVTHEEDPVASEVSSSQDDIPF